MSTESYTSRPMWLLKETTYSLERDGLLTLTREGGSRIVPWHQMASVRLHSNAQKNGPRVYFCQIRLKGERFPSVHFSQLRFQSVLTYLNQGRAYNAFVQLLTARIANEAPNVRFWTGAGPIERMVIFALLGIPALIAFVAGLMGLSGQIYMPGRGTPALIMLIGVALAGLAWWYYRRSQPKMIQPNAIPAEILAPV